MNGIEKSRGLSFSKRGRYLSLTSEWCHIPRWGFAMEVDGESVGGLQFAVRNYSESDAGFTVDFVSSRLIWHFDVQTGISGGPLGIRLSTTIENTTNCDVSLGKVTLLSCSEKCTVGSRGDRIRCLPLSGDLQPRYLYALDDPACPRESKIKTLFVALPDGDGAISSRISNGACLLVGFDSFRRCNTVVRHGVSAGGGVSGLEAYCDFDGWILPRGKTTETEVFHVSIGNDPYGLLENWAERAAHANDVRKWEDAPIGWLGWAWVDPFTVERYEEIVRRNIEAISQKLAGFGFSHVWISIGNIAGGTPGRWNEWNYDRFPGGPGELRRMLDEHGLKWGLWCGAYWVCELAETQLAELRDALLTDSNGAPLVVQPGWRFGDAGEMAKHERPPIYGLDPSHPKARAFLEQTFTTYRRWGVRYYMIDFLEAGAGNISKFTYATHSDTRLVSGPEVYHAGLSTIRDAAGDDTYMLTSSGPSIHNAGFADGIRTGNDFGEGRALYPDTYFYPATYVINNGGYWTGPRRALQNQASAYYTHRRLYINDSGNVLTVDKPITRSDAQINATIHAMSGGPSMVGDDLDRIDDERLAMIKATLPRPRNVARPVDLFTSVHPDYPKLFHRRVDVSWGRFDVIAIYNFTDEILRLPVFLDDLQLSPDDEYVVWEFWNAEYCGRCSKSFEAEVPPRNVRVFRFQSANRPVVAGTDMHLLMGEVELIDVTWDASSRSLSGVAIRPKGETGNIFIHVPRDLRVANPNGLWIAKDANDESLIVGVRLEFDDTPVYWRVQFAPLQASDDAVDTGKTGDW